MKTNHPFSPLIFTGEEIQAGTRLDVFLAASLNRSRSYVQGLIKRGAVEIEPPRARLETGSRLRSGDHLTVHLEPAPPETALPEGEDIPLHILFEDEALIVLNKQPGLVVHPAAGHASGTLVNALVHHCGTALAQRGGDERLGIVHRLDKDTSGVLLVAKTDLAHERLARQFAERTMRKLYRALAWGVFRRPSGECRGPIGRHHIHRKKMTVMKNPEKGRAAFTQYRVLSQFPQAAEVECVLHTGRTHQIRVHLAHLGHPIWADALYGRPHLLADGFTPLRQMLHASYLEFKHPLTEKTLQLEAPLPEDYLEARTRLA